MLLLVGVPREALLRTYKSFVRPNLDYGDIIFDKPNNESFKSRIQSIQYKACIEKLEPFKEHLGSAFTGS